MRSLLAPLSLVDDRIRVLRVVVLNVLGICDSRCVACDYWRTAAGPRLEVEALDRLLPALRRRGVRSVLLSGGEPLVHPDLDRLCARLDEAGIAVSLHTNGLRLAERAESLAPRLASVFVSLDGATRETYRRLRGVDGLGRVVEGLRAMGRAAPRVRRVLRSVVMAGNAAEIDAIVALAFAEGVDAVSFLALDASAGDAFGRSQGPPPGLARRRPTGPELDELDRAIDRVGRRWGAAAEARIEGGLEALRRIHRRYVALAEGRTPAAPRCNAPWFSAVVEPDGRVRPCFFQPAYGRLDEGAGLGRVLDGPEAVAFRRRLDVRRDPICRNCVCSKYFRLRDLWG